MTLFEDEPARPVRSGADWEVHRRHRHAPSGPPQDELGVPALSSFLLLRTAEVVVAVRGITAYSDGLHLVVVVLFADEQRAEDLDYAMDDFSRSPGRFRFGCVGADGRAAAGEEQPGQVPLTPAAVQVGPRAGHEQGHRVRLTGRGRGPHGRDDPRLLALLVVLEQREVELGLAAEVVVEAADAGTGPTDDIGDAGIAEAGGGEDLAGRGEQGRPRCCRSSCLTHRHHLPGPTSCLTR